MWGMNKHQCDKLSHHTLLRIVEKVLSELTNQIGLTCSPHEFSIYPDELAHSLPWEAEYDSYTLQTLQTQGKIEHWHRSLKNQILLKNHHFLSGLEDRTRQFVDYYKHEHYHESLNNLTPVDVF